MKRAVVTGASGFVGGHALRILAEHFETLGVSRTPVEGRSTVQVGDYGDTPAGDVLIHLAETSHRSDVERAGEAYLETAIETLEQLLAKPFARVIYVSSAAVYGDESCTPRGPQESVRESDLYTRAKLACERLVVTRGGVVARFANLYGDGMSAGNVVSAILAQVPGEGPVRVLDDTPVRDFLWVDDSIAALSRMAESGAQGLYNVGSGIGTSVHMLARTALAVAGESQRTVVATQPSSRRSCTVLDIATTTRDFGWVPSTSLTDGLSRLIHSRGIAS